MTNRGTPQAQTPHGVVGRVFGVVMERMNGAAYAWALARLAERPPARLLEIGFGTGRLLEEAARRFDLALAAGVDPSPLMRDQAARRLARAARGDGAADLRLGSDATLDWPDGAFDAIAAVHAFQFWAEPERTLARVRALLAPDGVFVLVLRRHGAQGGPAWLANPLSRTADEVAAARAAVERAGFVVERAEAIGGASYGLATRKEGA